ncbi:MAG TPA: fumarylacetoacetate hydrolase family protein, partial [Candidatus Binatus sp.]|nr:fumarylacetoacetate hydrolase family protein [Candidatus Binatus sp.]
LGPAKAKDFATSLGPWLVTPDELEDKKTSDGKYNLEMTAVLNGRQVSKGNMSMMHWSFPEMINYASQDVELNVGDLLGSGTVGSGSLVEQQTRRARWLEPGDLVELSIERLGTLRNRVIGSNQATSSKQQRARESNA